MPSRAGVLEGLIAAARVAAGLAAGLSVGLGAGIPALAADAPHVPVFDLQVVHVYPHDARAFTEGLFFRNGYLYESTGLEGQSSIREERLETGEIVRKIDIPPKYFGEGIIDWHGRLLSLTWKDQLGFIFDLGTFKQSGSFHYSGEGWALTRNEHEIFMSDGTSELRVLDPATLRERRRIPVTLEGKPLSEVNELEWVKGEILANVWQTDWIVRIDPKSGRVTGMIDASGLLHPADRVAGQTDVLNGIAYDAAADRLFVTGKNWPKLFEVKLLARSVMRQP
jgi:glutaminyl-peptide cyclotransferase